MLPKKSSAPATGFQFKLPPGYIPPPPPARAQATSVPSYATVMSSLQPNAYGFTLTHRPGIKPPGQVPPPPPPKAGAPKSHPLSLQAAYRPILPSVSAPKFVDKSNGVLASVMNGVVMPVGLQDWVNRVYGSVESLPGNFRFKADACVRDTVGTLLSTGELWKLHWISYPIPSIRDIATKATGNVIDLDVDELSPPLPKPSFIEDYISLLPYSDDANKKRKKPLEERYNNKKSSAHNAERDEELRKRSQRAQKYKEHLVSSPEASYDNNQLEGGGLGVKYEFGNDEQEVFEKTGQYSVVGQCQKLEKRYLRLTAAPDPMLVRPEPVLKAWLMELTKMWVNRDKEWKYIEDQLRAIRQDLTVQNIRGPFPTEVYETNARWALESGDVGQFNQCQTQLRTIHEQVDLGKASSGQVDVVAEFVSYRLLYYYFQNLRVDEQQFLSQILADDVLKHHKYVGFALAIRRHATCGNWAEYFELAKHASTQSSTHMEFLLQVFHERQRVHALIVLCKAFVTQISTAWLAQILGFDSTSTCVTFLKSHGAVFKAVPADDDAVDPRASFPIFSQNALVTGTKVKFMG